jgi:DNA-binding GntR family transcriptional regulator
MIQSGLSSVAGAATSASTTPERGRRVEATYGQLRKLIVHGRLAPGSRIVEADLAERLGVSRTPVRDALRLLQQEGYVVSSSAKGGKARLVVAPLTKEDARELYRIVGHIEGLTARQTAELPREKRDEVIRKLNEYNEGLRELAEQARQDPNRIFELDMNFHRTIVEASAGPRLLALHNAVKPQTERYWRLYASAIVERLSASVAEHTQILQAIAAGDGAAAESGVELNWLNGAERLSTVIDTLGERGSW